MVMKPSYCFFFFFPNENCQLTNENIWVNSFKYTNIINECKAKYFLVIYHLRFFF